MAVYDGGGKHTVQPGNFVIARKHQLVRYIKYREDDAFEKVVIALDEAFLKQFQKRHPEWNKEQEAAAGNDAAFLFVQKNKWLESFITSLEPYLGSSEQLEEAFADVKREELLLILLKTDASLAQVLFDYGIPQKIDLREFMNKNFRFNVSLERFAFLTGRSLSSFRRDFQKTFGEKPAIWLKRKRLNEAYFLIHNNHLHASDVYQELGFEDLSHFSYVFKQQFGVTPTQVYAKAVG
ncbi:hypothetical protein GCM10011379_35610 [Filimonas zeae]|uniref:HTH araC/xylS-type domain-containing protein n=2 Tax=Filimonas zeae TaxID=1737353 RepID=A0A917MX62_9BACT|nr:hypothetical protein GCM10011379_35610 [Filimonas zeae]